jgi:hypothetical protein
MPCPANCIHSKDPNPSHFHHEIIEARVQRHSGHTLDEVKKLTSLFEGAVLEGSVLRAGKGQILVIVLAAGLRPNNDKVGFVIAARADANEK